MKADYQVNLYDHQGVALRAPFYRYTRLEYVARVNGAGHFALHFPAAELPIGTDLERLAADGRVVVWRQIEGMLNTIDFVGLVRLVELYQSGQEIHVKLVGYTYNELLVRRIVAYAAGSAEAQKAGPADTVIGALWNENFGAGAAAARRITGLGFSLGAIAGTGTAVSIAFSRQNVLEAMTKVAEQSQAVSATAAYFGFVPLADGLSARFDVRVGVWGTDRRAQLIFGLDYGNMAGPEYEVDRRDELTFVYCAGQGREGARMEGTPQQSAALNDSPLNRREGFFDGRNYTTVTALENAAREKLDAAALQRALEFDVQETSTCRYGQHWFLGDLGTGTFAGVTRDYMITGTQVTVAGGKDTVKAVLQEYG